MKLITPLAPAFAVAACRSFSEDPENDPLDYFWFESGEMIPFATGVRVTNELAVGTHSIALRVSDGYSLASSEVTVDVITAGEAVDALLRRLVTIPGLKGKARPLFATLKAAIASFDRGSMGSGVNQLHAVQNKIRAQIGRTDPALADELIRAVQSITDVVR